MHHIVLIHWPGDFRTEKSERKEERWSSTGQEWVKQMKDFFRKKEEESISRQIKEREKVLLQTESIPAVESEQVGRWGQRSALGRREGRIETNDINYIFSSLRSVPGSAVATRTEREKDPVL